MWWLARIWLPIAVAVTVLSIVLYATVQQNYRQSLNDPQIQMAEDAASSLQNGAVPAAVVPRGIQIDIAQSLAPWIAVYDATGTPLESTAVVDNAPAKPPIGVLTAARDGSGKDATFGNENRVTWEPRDGARQAIVVVAVTGKDQYVVVGRNMREVENREWQLQITVFIGWILALAATLIASWIGAKFAEQSHVFAWPGTGDEK